MKWLSVIAAIISAFVWGASLLYYISEMDFLACVLLPQHSISDRLWFGVVFPTAMLTLAITSLVLVLLTSLPKTSILWLPFVTLVPILIFYVGLTGLAVDDSLASECGR